MQDLGLVTVGRARNTSTIARGARIFKVIRGQTRVHRARFRGARRPSAAVVQALKSGPQHLCDILTHIQFERDARVAKLLDALRASGEKSCTLLGSKISLSPRRVLLFARRVRMRTCTDVRNAAIVQFITTSQMRVQKHELKLLSTRRARNSLHARSGQRKPIAATSCSRHFAGEAQRVCAPLSVAFGARTAACALAENYC